MKIGKMDKNSINSANIEEKRYRSSVKTVKIDLSFFKNPNYGR